MSFWGTRVSTTIASQMMMVAVGYQMYDLTHSALDLGLVGLLQFLPALALTLVIGHIADHFDRRLILALCTIGQIFVAIGLIWASLSGWVNREHILLASFILGTTKSFQMPTQQALAPSLVPEEMLPRALAFISAGTQFAIIAGPAVGGFVYVGGPHCVYTLCALLFLVGLFFISRIKYHHVSAPKNPVTYETLFAGVHFIWNKKPVLGAISLDLFAVLLGGAVALLPIYAKDILHTGSWGLGLLRAGPAVGAFFMSLWLTKHPIERNTGKVMFSAVALYGVATIVFGISTNFILSLVMLILSGVADMISVVIRQSLVQLETPNQMRGRVSAVNSIFIGASNQLGEFESGVTAALFGAVPSVVIGGLGTLMIVGLWMKLFPTLTNRDRLRSEK